MAHKGTDPHPERPYVLSPRQALLETGFSACLECGGDANHFGPLSDDRLGLAAVDRLLDGNHSALLRGLVHGLASRAHRDGDVFPAKDLLVHVAVYQIVH